MELNVGVIYKFLLIDMWMKKERLSKDNVYCFIFFL